MQKMPSLGDLAVAAMVSFVGFGLVIGAAQASIIEPNLKTYENLNYNLKLQRMVSQEARRINSIYVLSASSTLSYNATSTTPVVAASSSLPVKPTLTLQSAAVPAFNNFVAGEIVVNGIKMQEVAMPPLMPGWNAVTLPVEPTDANIQKILAPIAGRYSKVTTITGGVKVFDPKLPQFATLKELHAGQGFLINITSATPVYLKAYGYRTSGYFSSLSAGWNLVGATGYTPVSVVGLMGQANAYSVYTLAPGTKDTNVKVYYPNFTFFEPGRSYYINNK